MKIRKTILFLIDTLIKFVPNFACGIAKSVWQTLSLTVKVTKTFCYILSEPTISNPPYQYP